MDDRDEIVRQAVEAYLTGRTITDANDHRRPKPYAEQFALWEAMWEAADFSWEGLADAGWNRGERANKAQFLKRWRAPLDFPGDHEVDGEGDQAFKQCTLQDYWRWVPNEGWTEEQGFAGGRLATDDELSARGLLHRVGGQAVHAIHRSVTLATEPELAAAIKARLALARAGWNADFTGAKVQNLDAIWRKFAGPPKSRRPLFISAPFASFDTLDVSRLTFEHGVSFGSATFGDKARFISATFGDRASFDSAAFGNAVRFVTTTFGDAACFESATFGDRASFYSATFADGARFTSATFGNGVRFGSTAFGNGASFGSATFGDRASFGSAAFGNAANFGYATFGNAANFGYATFGNGARFYSTTFGDDTQFKAAKFGDWAWFGSATFGDKASFDSATFGDGTRFARVDFRGEVALIGARFGSLNLSDGNIAGKLNATYITCTGRFRMRAAEVKGYADFSSATWPRKHEDQHAAFKGCRFRDVANFETKDFAAFALFDGAVFSSRVLLTEPAKDETSPDDLFARALSAAKAAAEQDRKDLDDLKARQEAWQANPDRKPEGEPTDPTPDERGADARYGALAGGLRTLKLAMAGQRDIDREQRFYRYEVQARARRPSEPWAAKAVAWLYGRVSGYGASIGRPLVWISIVFLACAAFYWLWGWSLGVFAWPLAWDDGLKALDLSFTNTFRPIAALIPQGSDANVLARTLHDKGGGTALAFRVASTLQSLTALILAFLFGLAVRRRFQMA